MGVLYDEIHGHHLVTAAQTAESSFEFVNSCSLVSIRGSSTAWIRLRDKLNASGRWLRSLTFTFGEMLCACLECQAIEER
jgi:hypothetical protein